MAEGPGSSPRQLLSVAPMMDWTDVHFRQLARLLSRRTWLWTEMVVDKTLIHTQHLDRFLWFPPEQHPIVCQLGGSEPELLAAAVQKVVQYGYDEINLNCGCPSDRVAGAGCFGAALMLEPELVGSCMAAMAQAAGSTPVNVKCRLGVDQVDSYDALHRFISVVSQAAPVTHFIIHARKCFLKGLNPHQNRTIPPLRYEWVYGLKRDFPHLTFSLNGGVAGAYEAMEYINYSGPFSEDEQPRSSDAAQQPQQPTNSSSHVAAGSYSGDEQAAEPSTSYSTSNGTSNGPVHGSSNGTSNGVSNGSHAGGAAAGGWLEGVMIGRQAYNDPWGVLADADRAVFGEPTNPATSRRQVLEQYAEYAAQMQGRWVVKEDGHQEPSVRVMMKAILNLFHGEKGSKKWKSEVDTVLKNNPPSVAYVLQHTLHLIPDEVLDAPPRQGPCAEAAQKGITSAVLPPPISMARLPRFGDRAGFNQDPEGVDTKRGGPAKQAQPAQQATSPAAAATLAAANTDFILSQPAESGDERIAVAACTHTEATALVDVAAR